MVSFDAQNLLILRKSNLSAHLLLLLVLLVSYLKICCQIQGHEDLFLFSSKSLIVLALIFRSLTQVDLVFTYDVR